MKLFGKKKEEKGPTAINHIEDRELKENLANEAITYLVNRKELDPADLAGLTVEFGYVLEVVNHGLEALFKLLQGDKVYYFAFQKTALRWCGITEQQYQSTIQYMMDYHFKNKT